MPCGFYTGIMQTSTAPETCRTCHGQGIVVKPLQTWPTYPSPWPTWQNPVWPTWPIETITYTYQSNGNDYWLVNTCSV